METLARRLARSAPAPRPEPGFIGPEHTAVEVLGPSDLAASDPFVLLMDDRLDLPVGRKIGDAHPHAGLETVTLILDGSLHDRDEGELRAGDAVWMTAGSGIIHSENVFAEGDVRVLQLWIRLPARDRTIAPRFEVIHGRTLPIRREPGAVARLYSGTTGDLRSPTKNRAPITLLHLALDPGATFVQELPRSYNGFVYGLEGSVNVAGTELPADHVGWLDRPSGAGPSTLTFTAGPDGARLVLYAGEPQDEPLVHYGPFVAGSPAEINELFRRYRAGRFESMSAIARRNHSEEPRPPRLG
jgi:hypothetical protein